jgi:DNA sulfur modification protein DndD
MIINKIIIDNYGVFCGRHEFVLHSDKQTKRLKPIILFGGMNGAGKTTLFNAIKLCLYGDNISDQRSNGNYKDFLKDKIHQSSNLLVQANYASVELEFQYSKNGKLNTFIVERQWEVDQGKIIENLNVKQDGEDLDEVEKESWQEFVKELIPVGLSQLFFFDGEKIQKMMSDDSNEEFKKSIKAMLGLDLVERLKADLKIYRTKYLKEKSSKPLERELEVLENKLSLVKANKRKLEDQKSTLTNNVKKTENIIAEYKDKIASQGGNYLKNRESLISRKSALENEIEIVKEKLRDLCADLLPVSLAPELAKRLREQIIKENEAQDKRIAAKLLSKKSRTFLNKINGKEFLKDVLNLKTTDLKKIKEHLKSEVKNHFDEKDNLGLAEILHGMSQQQTSIISHNIDSSLNDVPNKIKVLTKEFERKFRTLQKIQVDLQRVPDDELVRPMHEKLNELYKELGCFESETKGIDDKVGQLINDQNEIERKIEQADSKLQENNRTDKKLILVKKTEEVIDSYYEDLAKLKSHNLTNEFTNIFNSLHRKKDMIHRIDINPVTFDVCLYDINNKAIDKYKLSSGEMEIYAMSMVWGLAKISGQNLPFIIDTPLGRLDSHHRDNILNIFFPNASHQMLIFSTDTEVDRKNFEILKPHISSTFHLEHSDKEKNTKVKKGYFWN